MIRQLDGKYVPTTNLNDSIIGHSILATSIAVYIKAIDETFQSFRKLQKRIIEHEFADLFPDFPAQICSNCPVRLWKPRSCSLTEYNTLVMEFVATETEKDR